MIDTNIEPYVPTNLEVVATRQDGKDKWQLLKAPGSQYARWVVWVTPYRWEPVGHLIKV